MVIHNNRYTFRSFRTKKGKKTAQEEHSKRQQKIKLLIKPLPDDIDTSIEFVIPI